MTYRAAIHGLAHIGIPDHPYPAVYCDGIGCTVSVVALTRSGGPPAWLLNGKAPKGWAVERDDDKHTRLDWCPDCRKQRGTP